MGLQQTITEGFSEYHSPIHKTTKWRRCDHESLLEGPHQGAEGVPDSVDRDTMSSETQGTDYSINMEHMIDQELIQLQTYASIITSTLRRSEYHHNSGEPVRPV